MNVRERDGVHIVEVPGDFTVGRHLGNALDLQGRSLTDLRETIEELLQQDRTSILLNLGRVKFIDSAGLGELIACKKRAAERGGDIKILRPGGQVEKLLALTLLTDLFEIHRDEEAAVASFKTP